MTMCENGMDDLGLKTTPAIFNTFCFHRNTVESNNTSHHRQQAISKQ